MLGLAWNISHVAVDAADRDGVAWCDPVAVADVDRKEVLCSAAAPNNPQAPSSPPPLTAMNNAHPIPFHPPPATISEHSRDDMVLSDDDYPQPIDSDNHDAHSSDAQGSPDPDGDAAVAAASTHPPHTSHNDYADSDSDADGDEDEDDVYVSPNATTSPSRPRARSRNSNGIDLAKADPALYGLRRSVSCIFIYLPYPLCSYKQHRRVGVESHLW